jgi:hypothetical protein
MSSPACAERDRLRRDLSLFQGIRLFDKPRRDYNALQFTLTRRFSKKLYVQGSYTYSKTAGNYPGLISYDNGQVDPNISSQYDLIELLANRIIVNTDRPHYIKPDGGIAFRALSGIPTTRSVIISTDRTAFLRRAASSAVRISETCSSATAEAEQEHQLDVFPTLFNVYNRQGRPASTTTSRRSSS